MAIDPSTKYAGQVDTDAGYPYGKARNRSSPDSTDGTPLEQDWVNDVWGFFQAILYADADATPSGDPEEYNASQYLSALRRLQSGRQFQVLSGSEIRVYSGGDIIVNLGGTDTIAGTLNIASGGVQNVQDGGELKVNSGGTATLEDGSIFDWESGSNVNHQSGCQYRQYSGGTSQFDGTTTHTSGSTDTYSDGAVLTLNGTDNWPQLEERSEWVPCGGFWFAAYDTQWTNYDGIGPKTAVATAATSFWRVPVPEHYTISKVQVRWQGPYHDTWPPENRTVFSVYKVDTAGAKTLLATEEDTNDKATYESVHALTIDELTGSPWSATFTPGEFMLIEMVSESGTNAEQESQWLSSQMYATFDELRTAGG